MVLGVQAVSHERFDCDISRTDHSAAALILKVAQCTAS